MSSSSLDIVVVPGSLREGSFNRALARALPDLAPSGVTLAIVELHDVPPYNADLDNDQDRPVAVGELKGRVDAADGLILVSPEYNYGVPGVLKNALDWVSRPAFRSPLTGKPVGFMGASPGAGGTMRGQEQLKLTLLAMACQVFPHRGVTVARAREKLQDGELTDEDTRSFVRDYLEGYASWVERRP